LSSRFVVVCDVSTIVPGVLGDLALVRRSSRLRVLFGNLGEACERGKREWMERRTWRERTRCLAPAFGEESRTKRDAAFSLTPSSAEARVALERLDVVVTASDGFLQLVESHVFTTADEHLRHRSPKGST
jgi:hypothetical protein